MKIGTAIAVLGCWLAFSAQAGAAKVYVRWTQAAIPAAKVLGVNEIVIPWNEQTNALLAEAKKRGYQAYVEAGVAQIADAANAAAKAGAAGMVLRGPGAEQEALIAKAKELRAAHPNWKVLVVSPNGKQPDMRGWLVFKKDGILQVSSPTSQPWLDANLAAIRYERAFGTTVPVYTFSWDESDALVKEHGPKPVDYALAIAEAGAYHADLILEVHATQQKGLASGDRGTLTDWEQVRRYLEIYKRNDGAAATQAEARVGVLTEEYESTYEALNLMARHNIPFRVMKASEVKPSDLAKLDVAIVFAMPGKTLVTAIQEFAANGGTAVLVKQQGSFPWETAGAGVNNGPSTTYPVGKGAVIALKEAVIDPETFAQDVRRLMPKANVPVSLWNSLTTLVAAYPGAKKGETLVELVNYDGDSTQVQVQVKGTYRSAIIETPEKGRSEKLKTSQVDGFTQFVVPDLLVGGTVRLE